jgi:hypothetical protein
MTDQPQPQPVLRLTLRAPPDSVPPEVRMRKLLKALLRAYRFRCTHIDYPADPATTVQTSVPDPSPQPETTP